MAHPNFMEKTFTVGSKTAKFVNVFSLKSVLLYDIKKHASYQSVKVFSIESFLLYGSCPVFIHNLPSRGREWGHCKAGQS